MLYWLPQFRMIPRRTTILCQLEEKKARAVLPLWKELIWTCGLTGDIDTAQQCIETLGHDVDNSIILAFSGFAAKRSPQYGRRLYPLPGRRPLE
jgi:hypothetical protein